MFFCFDAGLARKRSMALDGLEDFSVTEDGKLESVQVYLSDLPLLGQRTLKQQIGNGKLLLQDSIRSGRSEE